MFQFSDKVNLKWVCWIAWFVGSRMYIHKLELNFSDFCKYSYIYEINHPPLPPPAQKKIIKISGSSLEENHQRPITGRELIRFQKAVFLIWDISLPKYDKICYATLMFSSFYPYADIIETGHVRSKSTAILK